MISAAPDAPPGSITTLLTYSVSDFPPTSAVLCRNTAPVVRHALTLLRKRVPCHVLGRDIAEGLVDLLDKVRTGRAASLTENLSAYCGREVSRKLNRGDAVGADAIRDRCDALTLFLAEPDPASAIRTLFRDGPGITLSTIHKAKGLEWDTVFILDRDLLPSPWAKGWQLEQERNLHYVAVTRARVDLRYIRSGAWRQEEKGVPA